MSDSELIVSTPLAGNICPSCARTDAIVRETSTRPWDRIDLIGAWMFGILGLLTVITGRKTVRLRCQHCQCRFPSQSSAIAVFFAWALATAFVTTIVALLASLGGPYQTGTMPLLDRASRLCEYGVVHPLTAIMVVAIPVFSAVVVFFYASLNARYDRAQIIRAVAKRDLVEHGTST